MAKFRYRSGNQWKCGGVTLRTPVGAVGHGGLSSSCSWHHGGYAERTKGGKGMSSKSVDLSGFHNRLIYDIPIVNL